jgi:RND superfamily putative drug exporter
MTMLASVTLLPAVLGFVGRTIDRLGLPHRHRGEASTRTSSWHAWSKVVQSHPWRGALATLVVLLALGTPVFAMRLGFSDAGIRPEADTTRAAYDLLSEGFGPGFNGPLLLAAESAGGAVDLDTLGSLIERLEQTPGLALVAPPVPSPDGAAAIVAVVPTTSPQEEATTDLAHELRREVIPGTLAGSSTVVKVGGGPAAVIDFADYTASRQPLFIGAILALSFLLLMVVFRSVLVPLKAVVMNLLSIGAAYGVVVAVFQWGWGADLLGVGEPGPVEVWVPTMLFAIVFGLSVEYEVFLLSRIREEYDRSGDNSRAVSEGLASTARVITAAAAVMVCVFASFVLGDVRAIQMFGLGLATAILVDATLVRLVLVPATMELLGDRNWWLPAWLDRLLPSVKVDGTLEGALGHEPSPESRPGPKPAGVR